MVYLRVRGREISLLAILPLGNTLLSVTLKILTVGFVYHQQGQKSVSCLNVLATSQAALKDILEDEMRACKSETSKFFLKPAVYA